MGAVVSVREASVEREVIGRVRVHLGGGDGVEPLWRLAVALPDLRPKLTRPAADREGFEARVFAIGSALPDLELRFLLIGPHQDPVAGRHALLGHKRKRLRRDWS